VLHLLSGNVKGVKILVPLLTGAISVEFSIEEQIQ